MPFVVQAHADDHTLTVTTETAKEAFAKAIDWHVVHKFTDVTISDGVKRYSIDGFSSVMALQEIANTVEAAAELGPKD
jgi:3-oxoacyl-[acyl-carrier-protein] synthase III